MTLVTGYFKGDKLVGFTYGEMGGVPTGYTSTREIDSSLLADLLGGDYLVDIEGVDTTIDNSTINSRAKSLKSQQCKIFIERTYDIYSQINVLREGAAEKVESMNWFVDEVLTEFRTQGKKARFGSLFLDEQANIKEIVDNTKDVATIELDYTTAELKNIAMYLSNATTYVSHIGTDTQISQAIRDHFNL